MSWNNNQEKMAGEEVRGGLTNWLQDLHYCYRSPPTCREGCDLSRTRSFRVEPKSQRIFRASDLVKGRLLGQGFFGKVYQVTHRDTGEVMVLKELYRVEEDAQKNFLKEVSAKFFLSKPPKFWINEFTYGHHKRLFGLAVQAHVPEWGIEFATSRFASHDSITVL